MTAAPADNAAITVKTGTGGSTYRQSLLLDPAAVALVSRPLDIPTAGLKTSTRTGNKVTVSVSEWVDGNTLAQNMRFDMLWGVKVLDPAAALARLRDNRRAVTAPPSFSGGADDNGSRYHLQGVPKGEHHRSR